MPNLERLRRFPLGQQTRPVSGGSYNRVKETYGIISIVEDKLAPRGEIGLQRIEVSSNQVVCSEYENGKRQERVALSWIIHTALHKLS